MEKYNDKKEMTLSKAKLGADGLGMEVKAESDDLQPSVAFDLEQMREQLGILKQKLDKQTIVTDRLIHQAMKQKMSWITKYCWFEACILFPVFCIGWWEIKDGLGMSIYSYLLLSIFTGCCVGQDILINRMKSEDWENDNLVQTAEKLVKMKRIRKKQTSIQMALLILIIGIIGYDVYTAGVVPTAELEYMGISCLVGLLIGGAVGLRILAKMQHTNDDIIHQIEELTKD